MNKARFPAEEIKAFLANPCKKTLDKILYPCYGECADCIFEWDSCPPDNETLKSDWKTTPMEYYEEKGNTLASLVLSFSEVLTKYEAEGERHD